MTLSDAQRYLPIAFSNAIFRSVVHQLTRFSVIGSCAIAERLVHQLWTVLLTDFTTHHIIAFVAHLTPLLENVATYVKV